MQNAQILDLGEYSILIAQDNTGRPAAYVNGAEESSASGEEEILASFLAAARNSCGEDELYAAIEAAKNELRQPNQKRAPTP